MTTSLFKIPQPIMENMEKLNELVEKYPFDIPVTEVAKLLGMKPENLRAAIDCGTFKPGFSWRKGNAQNKGYKIATIPFWRWYTQTDISAEVIQNN